MSVTGPRRLELMRPMLMRSDSEPSIGGVDLHGVVDAHGADVAHQPAGFGDGARAVQPVEPFWVMLPVMLTFRPRTSPR